MPPLFSASQILSGSMRLMTFLICTVLSFQLMGQTAFSAIMQKTASELIYLYAVPLEEVQKQNEQYAADGFELIDLEYSENKFWAIWKQSGEAITFEQADSWKGFQELKKQKIKDGRLLSNLLTYKDEEGKQQFIGFWKNKRLAHNIWKLPDLKNVLFHYKEMAKLSLYLQDIQVVEEADGQFSYYALYHKGSPDEMTHLTHFTNETAFNEDHAKRLKSNYSPIDIEVLNAHGIPNYFCLYRKQKTKADLQYQLGWESLVHYQNHMGETYKLVDLEFSSGKQRVFAPPFHQQRVKKTPDVDLASLQISTKGTQSAIQNNSPALAAANGLYWLSENGFDKLNPGTSAKPEQAAAKIARKLADGNHMKTLLPSKANKYTVINGLNKYIRENYQLEEIQFFDIHGFDQTQLSEHIQDLITVEDSLEQIPLSMAKKGMVGSTIVLVQWGHYEPSQDGKHLIKKADQWGTLVGYGKNEHDIEKSDYITIHDPADGKKGAQKYLRIDDLEQFFITTDETSLKTPSAEWKDEAEDYISLPAVKRQVLAEFDESADEVSIFPVWESLLIIRIK